METADTIFQLLSHYGWIAIVLGSMFFGEAVIITGAFIAATGLWPVSHVFIFAFIGTIISDSIWFFFGQSLLKNMHRWLPMKKRYTPYVNALDKTIGKHPLLLLLYIKFLYGTRIITIIYLSVKKITFPKFIVFNSIGTIIWLIIMISIGWIAGMQSKNYNVVIEQVGIYIIALTIVLISIRLITMWTKNKLVKE